MKYIKYIIIALTAAFAAACAEEEPSAIGSLDAKVSVSQITATTATINVDLTNCAEIFEQISDEFTDLECQVSLINFSGYGYRAFYIRGYGDNPNELTLTGSVTFEDLQPSTPYTFCIVIPSPIGDIGFRSAEYTFTTAKEGDYSELISLEEVVVGDQLAIFNFELPFDLGYSGLITVSKNSDMSESLDSSGSRSRASLNDDNFQGVDISRNSEWIGNYRYYENSIAFKGLEPNTTYYWYITGTVDGGHEFKSPTYSFTTSDTPDPIVSKALSSVLAGIQKEPGYCYLSGGFNFEADGLTFNGDLYTEKYENYLEYSKDYPYTLRLNCSGRYNGHYVDLNNFYYYNTLRTPDKQ